MLHMPTTRAKPEKKRLCPVGPRQRQRVLSALRVFSCRRNGQNLPARTAIDKMAAHASSLQETRRPIQRVA